MVSNYTMLINESFWGHNNIQMSPKHLPYSLKLHPGQLFIALILTAVFVVEKLFWGFFGRQGNVSPSLLDDCKFGPKKDGFHNCFFLCLECTFPEIPEWALYFPWSCIPHIICLSNFSVMIQMLSCCRYSGLSIPTLTPLTLPCSILVQKTLIMPCSREHKDIWAINLLK